MSRTYPKDTPEKSKERESFSIFFPMLDSDCWEQEGQDSNDHGVDHTFEYIEDGEYKGYRILAQVKGRTEPEIKDDYIVFDFPVKTANYAIGCSQPFVFIFVDLTNETAYYLPLQDYFIANPEKMEALEQNKSTVRVFVPLGNTIESEELKNVAEAQYCFDGELRKTR